MKETGEESSSSKVESFQAGLSTSANLSSSIANKPSRNCFFEGILEGVKQFNSNSFTLDSIDHDYSELLEVTTSAALRTLVQKEIRSLRDICPDWETFKIRFFYPDDHQVDLNSAIVGEDEFERDLMSLGSEENGVPFYLLPLASFVLGITLDCEFMFRDTAAV